MRKWEHKWDVLEHYNSIIKHYELMTKRSSQGWELVTVVMVNVGTYQTMRFYWKREMKEGGNND